MSRGRRLLPALALALTAAATPGWPRDLYATLPDQRRIHLVCTGKGSPTVILESGFGADSNAWYRVQPALSETMRVCAYDRAGAGLSSEGPYPRDGAAIAADLDAALRAARITGPFIGVGHSAGGLYIRLFAARRRDEMQGLVLVDPSVEHQTRRSQAVYGPGAGSIEGIRRAPQRCLEFTSIRPIDRKDPSYAACVGKAIAPADVRAALSPGKWKTQLSELDTLFNVTSDEVVAEQAKVWRVPTIILTAGSAKGQPADAGEALQRRFHGELKGKFEHAEQRMVDSGHLMFFDRPEAIVQAARDLAKTRR